VDLLIIGVDTGGTFTDFLYNHGGRWRVYKVLSTPDDPARAVLQGLEHITRVFSCRVVHGSTVATNAVLERKGVKTAVITNAGFEDLLVLGRQNRSRLYDLFYRKPDPLVPASLRFGIQGRIDASGSQVQPLDAEALDGIVQSIREQGVQSIAVCLLFSYLNPGHEQAVYARLQELGLPVSMSHAILPEFREFERLSTTVLNAYVSPVMSGYLQRIKDSLAPSLLRIMQSNGGSISVEQAMQEPVRTILSGPAGGVVGALHTAGAAGFERIITLDMGGTSTDVCLVDGELPLSTEASLSGLPLGVPMLDIHTVGAGGGSIAVLDEGGALKVGPESAGSDPGPICYGRGRQITVTDAHLFLGRLRPDRFLGGEMVLDKTMLNQALTNMAGQAGLDPLQLAEGILAVADASMERAIRVISVEKGYDPREFTLVSFGGAGGLHCAGLAMLLSIPRVLIPVDPGVLSARGMVQADVIRDYSLTVMIRHKDAFCDHLEKMFRPLEQKALHDMQEEGFASGEVSLQHFLDMRYKGQSFEIMVPWDPGDNNTDKFHELHRQKYGHHHPDREVELVNVRLRAVGFPDKPGPDLLPRAGPEVPDEARLGEAKVMFQGGFCPAVILDRNELRPGNEFSGPAIVTEYTSTVVFPPFARGRVDHLGNIIMEIS